LKHEEEIRWQKYKYICVQDSWKMNGQEFFSNTAEGGNWFAGTESRGDQCRLAPVSKVSRIDFYYVSPDNTSASIGCCAIGGDQTVLVCF